jgi:hypothetical protein
MKLRGENREGERVLNSKTKLLIATGVASAGLLLSPDSANAEDATPPSGSESSTGSGSEQQSQQPGSQENAKFTRNPSTNDDQSISHSFISK